jgi:ribosomal protein S18 acetylase RimI-like enzyme
VAGGGVGSIWQGPPGPGNPDGRRGYIYSMATNPEWRGRGIARGVVTALLDWFVAEGITAVDLHATAEGEPVYRALGFTDRSYPELSWRPSPQPPLHEHS